MFVFQISAASSLLHIVLSINPPPDYKFIDYDCNACIASSGRFCLFDGDLSDGLCCNKQVYAPSTCTSDDDCYNDG